MTEFLDLNESRRSVYHIGRNSSYSAEDVADRLKELTPSLPTAFNIQTTRFVVVSDQVNEGVWDIIDEVQKEVLPGENYEIMAPVYQAAKEGIGTVLLFEDLEDVESMPTGEERAHRYKENNHGIAALATWLALREMDLGASLHHHNIGYDEGYDLSIKEYLGLPQTWELIAQMPFGSIETYPDPKDKMDVDEQVLYID